MIRHVCSTDASRAKSPLWPQQGVVEEALVGLEVGARVLFEEHLEVGRLEASTPACFAMNRSRAPARGRCGSRAGSGRDARRRPRRCAAAGGIRRGSRSASPAAPSRRGCRTAPRPSASCRSERKGHEGLRLGVRRDALDLPVALVLPADVAPRVSRADGLEQRLLLVADRIRVVAGGRFHRDERQDLEQVVLDDVAARPGRRSSRGRRRRSPRPSRSPRARCARGSRPVPAACSRSAGR